MSENITDKNMLKSWFKRGLKPTALQFAAWMDSYWHKSEPIPTATIEGLETILNSKAETADITSIRAGMEEHANDDSRHKTAGEQSKLDNLTDNADATYARNTQMEYLETYVDEQDAAGLQAAKDYTDVLASNVYKKAETDNKYVFKTDMPETLKNPYAITFTGAVSDIYDGSVAKTVNIPVGLSLGETSATAYRGDRGKMAYDYAVSKRTMSEVSGLQAALDGKLGNSGNQTLNSHMMVINSTTQGGYFEFHRNNVRKGFVGLGASGNDDIYLQSSTNLRLYGTEAYFNDMPIVISTDSRLSNARPANGGNSASCSGNAATATKLQTARTINGVSFDGSANITIPNSWNDITGKPIFAPVATTGSYNDLSNKPAIPAAETAATVMNKINSQAEITFTKHLVCTNGAGTTSTSDMRFKKNVYNLRNLLPVVVNAPLFNYTWKDEPGVLIGSSAQYWEQYLPELVYDMEDGTKTLSYERLGGVIALKAIQELNEKLIKEVNRLTEEINKLKNR